MFDQRLVFDHMPVLDRLSLAGPDGRRMDLRQPRGAGKHEPGFLITCHCVEVQIMSARTMAGKFPLCDGYFCRVEVPFLFLAETPAVFLHAGIQMADDPQQRFLCGVFYMARAQSCAGELLSEAE